MDETVKEEIEKKKKYITGNYGLSCLLFSIYVTFK
jgi:hypothetical protein